jgi:UDP-N-acetylglucosamine 2-epimerase (non-hydrolysing)
MRRFEPVCERESPDIVLVVGDVNSTLAAALVAVKLGVPVAHVEAGLRSFDRSMPEEINRLVTDAISDLHFTTEPSANDNLRREGVPESRIHYVGNVMIDTLFACRERAAQSPILPTLGLRNGSATPVPYGVVTLHRPSNVDDHERLARLMNALHTLADEIPLVFPVHPRTVANLDQVAIPRNSPGLRLMRPLGYLDFVQLLAHARLVITDSGGIQEETTYLGIPCLTVREITDRPITVHLGTNHLVGHDMACLKAQVSSVLGGRGKRGAVPPLWDGHAAGRIADHILGKQ